MTKASELRLHDRQELNQRLDESRKELFNLRFQLATGRLDNISRITTVRREIARLLTLLGQPLEAVAPAAASERPARRSSRRAATKTTEDA